VHVVSTSDSVGRDHEAGEAIIDEHGRSRCLRWVSARLEPKTARQRQDQDEVRKRVIIGETVFPATKYVVKSYRPWGVTLTQLPALSPLSPLAMVLGDIQKAMDARL
jgi:hypothetical protein